MKRVGSLSGNALVKHLSGGKGSLQKKTNVQRKGDGGTAAVHNAASNGISGSSRQLPHFQAIQHSFGGYDVSGVSAHVGGPAAQACESMGALAYATGNNVAFKKSPDLHTAAHEAAHVVQQRAGVSLKGGVGEVGDKYERHADAVADAVVQGKSAESILSEMTGSSPAPSVQQRAVQFLPPEGGTNDQGNYDDHGNVGHASESVQNPDGVSVGVSTENGGTMSAQRQWDIWKSTPPIPPIALPVPGLFLTVSPSVSASVGAQFQGVQSGESARQYQASITGTVQVGVEYGAPPAASLYLRAGPVINAQMQGTFDDQGLQSLSGTLSLDATVSVGAQAGSGAFDYNVLLGRVNIARFNGFTYTRGRGTSYGQFQPGQDIIDALNWAKSMYQRARQLSEAGAAAVRRAGSAISDAWSWIRS